MNGLVSVVTGCSEQQGFGRLTVAELGDRGHRVIATMRDIAGRNRDLARELGRTVGVEVEELDVTDDDGCARLVAGAIERHGRIDALVNNAAEVRGGALEDTPAKRLSSVLDTNVVGPHRLIRAVLPSMRERGSGVIVQMSSVNGFGVSPLLGSYCTSKFALEAYSEVLAYEVGHFGVRVHVIEPSVFLTGIHERVTWEEETHTGPYAELKRQYWDEDLDDWVATMEDPEIVARAVADAIEDPSTPLHVPVGGPAAGWRAKARPMPDDEVRAEAMEGVDW